MYSAMLSLPQPTMHIQQRRLEIEKEDSTARKANAEQAEALQDHLAQNNPFPLYLYMFAASQARNNSSNFLLTTTFQLLDFQPPPEVMAQTQFNLRESRLLHWQNCVNEWRSAAIAAVEADESEPDCRTFDMRRLDEAGQEADAHLFQITETWKTFQHWKRFYQSSTTALKIVGAALELATPVYSGGGAHGMWEHYTTSYRANAAPARAAEERIGQITRSREKISHDLEAVRANVLFLHHRC